MKPGLELKQWIKLLALLLHRPVLWARANSRLINRGLCYFAQNPDVAWAQFLLDSADSAPVSEVLIIIAEKGRPVFSLILAKNLSGNISAQQLCSFNDLDSFREKIEADLKIHLPAVLIDATIIDRINLKLIAEKTLDPFFIAGREILASLAEHWMQFSPIIPEADMLASLNGEELLAKFGPRYGLRMENPVHFTSVVRGMVLLFMAPVTRRRMKKIIKSEE